MRLSEGHECDEDEELDPQNYVYFAIRRPFQVALHLIEISLSTVGHVVQAVI